jgi:aspartyl protease family protein
MLVQAEVRLSTVLRLLLILLVVLAGVLVMVAQNDQGFTGLNAVDLSDLAVKIVLVVVIGSFALTLFRERFATALQSALIWVVIALLLAIGYTYRLELQDVSERVLAEFVPGRVATRGRMVEVVRSGGASRLRRRSTAPAFPLRSTPARARSC